MHVTEQPIKNLNFFDFPRASPGDQPLAKEPGDSGSEIGSGGGVEVSSSPEPKMLWLAVALKKRGDSRDENETIPPSVSDICKVACITGARHERASRAPRSCFALQEIYACYRRIFADVIVYIFPH